VLIFLVLVLGGPLENRILASLPLTETARRTADLATTILRYVVSLLALMVLFGFIYWAGPDYRERPPYPWISPGAVVGVVAWLVASTLFSVYVSTFGSFSGPGSVYGPLANAILFMLWLQLTMFALLLGAEVNQVLRLQANTAQASRPPPAVRTLRRD
jgi:membrane protein